MSNSNFQRVILLGLLLVVIIPWAIQECFYSETTDYPSYIEALRSVRIYGVDSGNMPDSLIFKAKSDFLSILSEDVIDQNTPKPFYQVLKSGKYRNSDKKTRDKIRKDCLFGVIEHKISMDGQYPSETFLKYWMMEKKPDFVPDFVNISSAGAGKLEKLHGIGPVKAKRIVRFRRNSDRGYTRPRDIMKVEGIGEETFVDNIHSIFTKPPTPVKKLMRLIELSSMYTGKAEKALKAEQTELTAEDVAEELFAEE